MTIQHHHEMTDAEITEIRMRTDAFIATLREAISEAVADLDPHSPCIDEARAGLRRIAATLDDVPYATFANIANIDEAMKRRTGNSVMRVLELQLRAVGCGPELDYPDAAALLAVFQPVIDTALELKRRKVN